MRLRKKLGVLFVDTTPFVSLLAKKAGCISKNLAKKAGCISEKSWVY